MSVTNVTFLSYKNRRGSSTSGWVMSVEGLEPSTNGLKGHCSAIELHARTGCILSCDSGRVNAIHSPEGFLRALDFSPQAG